MTVLAIVVLVVVFVVVLGLGIMATVGNYETYGFCLGWIFSNWMWEGLGQFLSVIAQLIGELLSGLFSSGD